MPIIKSAKKRVKQSAAARDRNQARKDAYKSTMREIKKSAEDGKDCSDLCRTFQSQVDHAVKHNIIHKNKAARLKHQAVTIAKSSSGAKPAKPAAKKSSAKATKKPAAKTTAKKKPATTKAPAKKPATKA